MSVIKKTLVYMDCEYIITVSKCRQRLFNFEAILERCTYHKEVLISKTNYSYEISNFVKFSLFNEKQISNLITMA